MAYYDSDDYFFGTDIDALVEEAFGDSTDIDYGSAAGYRPAPANRGRSALNIQVGWWNSIMRQLVRWGVSRDTLRNEQLQVVGPGEGTVRNNQPDIQAIDPLSRTRISIEVDRDRIVLDQALRTIMANDPNARAAGVVFDPIRGWLIEKHVYDRGTRQFRIETGRSLSGSDILLIRSDILE
jgi:hypothetical protein